MGWNWVQRIQVLNDEYKAEGIEKYDANQAQQVAFTISYGIGINKLLYLWAYQLGRYRRKYSPNLVFNLVTFAWVCIAALVGLTLLNLALLKGVPDQFTAASWGPISPIVYSLSTFTPGGEAGGIHPAGQWAYLLQVAGFATGGLLIFSVGLSFLVTFFRERDDTATQQLIDELKEEARKQEARFMGEYEVTVNEAYNRLCDLRSNAAGILTFLVQAIPSDFLAEPGPGPEGSPRL